MRASHESQGKHSVRQLQRDGPEVNYSELYLVQSLSL